MKKYTLEKVLYFAKNNGPKGLHVAASEFRHGTDLASLVTNAKKRGELTEVKMKGGDVAFHITDKGEIALLREQIAYRSNLGKSITEHLRSLIAKRASTPEGKSEISRLKEFLVAASSGDIPRKKGMGVGELVSMRAISQRIHSHEDVWALTDVGREYLAEINMWESPALQVKPEAEPSALNLSPLPKDMNWPALDQIFKDRSAVYDVQLDDPQTPDGLPHPEEMVKQGLLVKLAEDDLQAYYALTNYGADRLVEGLNPKAFLTDAAYSRFDISVSLSDYAKEGMALASRRLDPEALAGINDLHWDVCHLERIPLHDAVQALVKAAPALRENSPSAQHRKHESMLAIRGQVIERFGGALTAEQLSTVFAQECKKAGLPHSPELARHYMQSPRISQLAVAPRQDLLVQPVDTMPVMQSDAERDYQFEAPKLRPGA